MIKSLVTACVLVVISDFAMGQRMVVGLDLEYTVKGAHLGNSILFESKKQWALGAFYQTEMTRADDRSEKSRFYGTQVQFPFIKSDRLAVLGSLRAGLVMDKFFVVVPGLETRINLGKQFGIAFMMSPRMAYPAVATKLIIKLF